MVWKLFGARVCVGKGVWCAIVVTRLSVTTLSLVDWV